MASFLQYALSPFPRRRSRKAERSSTSSQDTVTSTPPPSSPAPKTRSVGIQTPVLQRRMLMGDAPSTPGSLRRLKEKTRGAWQASPLLGRRASQDTLREGSITPVLPRKASSPPPDPLHSPPTSRRHASPPATSSLASLSSHEPPPTPPSSCNSSYHFDPPGTPSSTRRCPSTTTLDSEGAHVVHLGAAGMGVSGVRAWEREVMLREVGGGRRQVMRESVRMSQCVVWECLPFPGKRKNQHKGWMSRPTTHTHTPAHTPHSHPALIFPHHFLGVHLILDYGRTCNKQSKTFNEVILSTSKSN
ncbi:mucin-2-like [Homarus americanus]|uniref:mucin-2-like n=1 Tax=Homarus americanus TaxID=6706 RepID=UPI001C44A72C|nr:mucin-2-like [Homarus americanus]